MLAIGKFFYDERTFAFLYCHGSEAIEFYRFNNRKWEKIGSDTTRRMPVYLSFERLNNNSEPVIVLSTPPNMNGNRWSEAYVYNPKNDKVHFAGNYCTAYEVDLATSTMTEEYGGSWYMPVHKIKYKWENDLLIPLRQVVLRLVTADMRHNDQIIEYYENLTRTLDGLKLIFSEPYDEANKKHQKYWDDFFTDEKNE